MAILNNLSGRRRAVDLQLCLSEAPDKEAVQAVHKEAHGLLADEMIEVREGV